MKIVFRQYTISGETIADGATGAFHLLGNEQDRIDSKYWKGLYREYTDYVLNIKNEVQKMN